MAALQELIGWLGQFENIGIVGFGVEGRSTYKFLKKHLPQQAITVFDQNVHALDDYSEADKSWLGEGYEDGLGSCDLLFRSPGIKRAELEAYILDGQTSITSQTDLFLQYFGRQTVGVTGTKGKSTTTSFVDQLLDQHFDSRLVGNIGVPFFDRLEEVTEQTRFAAELSCHQLSDARHAPHIGIITNIFEEHLDYYGTFEAYLQTKLNLGRYQQQDDYLAINIGNETLKQHRSEFGSVVVDVAMHADVKFPGDLGTLEIGADAVVWATPQSTQIIRLNKGIPGIHNRVNQVFAIIAAILCGCTAEDIVKGVASFRALPHRLELIKTKDGTRFYNDSIATIPEATIKAIEAIGKIDCLILGGFDRGIDYSGLATYLTASADVAHIVCTGDAGKRIYQLLQDAGRGQIDLKPAFRDAVALARQLTPTGATCLLSPAAASYNEFRNFEQRGEVFRELVLA